MAIQLRIYGMDFSKWNHIAVHCTHVSSCCLETGHTLGLLVMQSAKDSYGE